MPAKKTGYLLGIGSNIEPFDNFARIICLLLKCFEKISISRVLNIPPVGMNSHRYFLNAVVFIETELQKSELKAICNQIEVALGRDRNDPDSKLKDRQADLDILAQLIFPDDAVRTASSITDEYFLYPMIDEIKAYLSQQSCLPMQRGSLIQVGKLSFGETATTIYRDGNTGEKRIGQ
jgi:2-amino-4-hydroxy-6-hydroxymethyldihydropteridine diphosphokinase